MNGTGNAEVMGEILRRLREMLGADWEECTPMGIPGLSLNGLKARHKAILDVVTKDDATPIGQDKIYGAREFPDWKELSDQVEAELTRRREPFQKVPW
jgi:hypothetical protein